MKLSEKKYIKAALKSAYEAPGPSRKQEFLRGIRVSRVSNISFMLSQVSYIRKLVWVLSVVIIAFLIFLSKYASVDVLWPVTACMPFVAMIAVCENTRSNTYRMAELEMAARFSLKSIVFARMSIIGMLHLILLCILALFTGKNAATSFFQTGVYLLVPYLMTTVISLHAARKLRSNEVNYVCMGIATIVSVLDAAVQGTFPLVTSKEYFVYWALLLAVLVVFTIIEYSKNIFRLEEALWSL